VDKRRLYVLEILICLTALAILNVESLIAPDLVGLKVAKANYPQTTGVERTGSAK
jgi:hypothetical protein